MNNFTGFDPDQIKMAELISLNEMRAMHRVNRPLSEILGFELVSIDGADCSICRSDPSILLNRTFGLGEHQPISREQIHTICQLYKDNGIDFWFLHIMPELITDQVKQWLSEAGMKKNRGWMLFIHDMQTQEETGGQFEIKQIDASYAEEFARIVVPAFDMSESSIQLIANQLNSPEHHVYMTFDGSTPAGTGSIFVKDNIAYVGYGATHPDFRKRGSQGMLLRHRVNTALQMG